MESNKLMRFLDRYAGGIICFIFSAIYMFKQKQKAKEIKNVLFIELFEMGAAVMAGPSINYVKKKIKNPNIYCICLDKVKPSWELLEIIPQDNIYTINSENLFKFALSIITQTYRLRKKNIDVVIDLELFTRISSVISFLVKSKSKAGFYKYNFESLNRGNFYDIKCSFNQNTHISKNFLAVTKSAIIQAHEIPNFKGTIHKSELKVHSYTSDKTLNKKLRKRIKELYPEYNNNKIILMHPDVGAVLSVRNYPKESQVKVIKGLLQQYPEYIILLTGVNANTDVCSYIKEKIDDNRCINFCNKTDSIREFVELCTFSELLIVNDTGPAHFASLTNIKILTLFSTDSPFMYGPLGKCVVLYTYFQCSPCICAYNHKNSNCTKNMCLKFIKPSTVIEYCKKIIEGKKVKYRTINNEIAYVF